MLRMFGKLGNQIVHYKWLLENSAKAPCVVLLAKMDVQDTCSTSTDEDSTRSTVLQAKFLFFSIMVVTSLF